MSDKKAGGGGGGSEPWGVHVSAGVDQKVDDDDVSACTSGMDGEDTVENGVYGLAMGDGVLDETDVARGGGGVEAEVGDCFGNGEGDEEKGGKKNVLTVCRYVVLSL